MNRAAKRPLAIGRYAGGFWFRVFGCGLSVELARNYRPHFSERMGLKKAYYFAGLRFEVLL